MAYSLITGLWCVRCHRTEFFYPDTISIRLSSKVKDPNQVTRHGYKPPDANPVFQYHVVIIIISTIIININIIIFIFILSLLMGIKKVV